MKKMIIWSVLCLLPMQMSAQVNPKEGYVITNEGDTVLDSCMGSGTTAIACLKEHRHFLGFELNKDYFDIAQRRIRLERQQPQLDFTDG
jgi:methylase of polypeptide subunit release factors